MISKRQVHCHQVHRYFTCLLCRVVFLALIALLPARGGDKALPGSAVLQPAVESRSGITRSSASRSGHSFTYKLSAGWNLISINLDLDQRSQDLLKSKRAMTLSPDGNAYIFNGSLTPPQACWIYCHATDEITLSGTAVENFDFETNLKKGWNFVGPLYDYSLGDAGAIAWGWDGWRFHLAESLRGRHGYWIYWPGDYVAPPEDIYLVVDLSAGSEADSYPVSYLSSPPPYGWTDEYKTTKLVLRKIPAGSFIMGSLSMWVPGGELGNWGITKPNIQ